VGWAGVGVGVEVGVHCMRVKPQAEGASHVIEKVCVRVEGGGGECGQRRERCQGRSGWWVVGPGSLTCRAPNEYDASDQGSSLLPVTGVTREGGCTGGWNLGIGTASGVHGAQQRATAGAAVPLAPPLPLSRSSCFTLKLVPTGGTRDRGDGGGRLWGGMRMGGWNGD
jgi:hypothetical protein